MGLNQQVGVSTIIRSYRDLKVWEQGMALAELCCRNTRNFPKEELFGAVAQIRRAAASVPANIAEGHGRRAVNSCSFFAWRKVR